MKKQEELTEEMIDAPRNFFLGLELGIRRLSLMRKHLEDCGFDYSYWPDWARCGDGHITKRGQAILIYSIMRHAAPKEKQQ